MNKRYIDFVPVDRKATSGRDPIAMKKSAAKSSVANAKPAAKSAVRRGEHSTTFSRNTAGTVSKRMVRKEMPFEKAAANSVKKSEPASGFDGDRAAKFGVIEDYHPKFVKATVDKRPLGTASSGVRANFINVNKIEKRPLSKSVRAKNVYAKRPVIQKTPVEKTVKKEVKKEAKKEESKKPVVIITKPEKDSKVGLIVAVILTIILGAAAGTVAFLLLPK